MHDRKVPSSMGAFVHQIIGLAASKSQGYGTLILHARLGLSIPQVNAHALSREFFTGWRVLRNLA
jgi:hypothetical protein